MQNLNIIQSVSSSSFHVYTFMFQEVLFFKTPKKYITFKSTFNHNISLTKIILRNNVSHKMAHEENVYRGKFQLLHRHA